MTPEEAEALVPLACELIGSVRDFGPKVVANVLARVPGGRHDALAVVLAAMVDPDARPQQLLAWTQLGPVQSREWDSPVFHPSRSKRMCAECGAFVSGQHMARHRRMHSRRAA